MRILIVSDAWHPQVNGVVRTLDTLTRHLRAEYGDTVEVIGPDRFRTMGMPGYREIRLAMFPGRRLAGLADGFRPDAVHVATEGPLGWAMRALCRRRAWPFTTSFHTRFAEYLYARVRVPPAWSWAVLRSFHARSSGVMVATASMRAELAARGFVRVVPWTRGVDLERFRPAPAESFAGLARPVFLYAGRLAPEKDLPGFLALDLPGSKVVVGDGPQMEVLRRRFPQARFLGRLEPDALAPVYAGADAFVFPSRTDTFGLVLLESLACGTPVAALPVTGPVDVVGDAPVGALDTDLRQACLRALECDRAACRRHAERFTWSACAATFRASLVTFGGT